MKRCALYLRVSTLDQHPETQLYDLQQMARLRDRRHLRRPDLGGEARRPGLDQMLFDAKYGHFDVVMVWAFDRMARSVKHFLDVLEDLTRPNIEFISFRENIDTGGPLGRAIVVIVGAIAELERSLVIERVRSGMRRARLEGQRMGRPRVEVDEHAILRHRAYGQSLSQIANAFNVSKATVARVLKTNAPQLGAGS